MSAHVDRAFVRCICIVDAISRFCVYQCPRTRYVKFPDRKCPPFKIYDSWGTLRRLVQTNPVDVSISLITATESLNIQTRRQLLDDLNAMSLPLIDKAFLPEYQKKRFSRNIENDQDHSVRICHHFRVLFGFDCFDCIWILFL